MSDVPERGSPPSSPSLHLPHSGSPPLSLSLSLSLPQQPAHVSQIIVIEQGWSGVWGDLSLHPLPPSLPLSLLDIPAHVVKWPASISLFFFSPFPLTPPVTQKSINCFQVRSKTKYTIQVSAQPVGQLKSPSGQRPGRTDEGCHCSHTCEVVVNNGSDWWEFRWAFPLICQSVVH